MVKPSILSQSLTLILNQVLSFSRFKSVKGLLLLALLMVQPLSWAVKTCGVTHKCAPPVVDDFRYSTASLGSMSFPSIDAAAKAYEEKNFSHLIVIRGAKVNVEFIDSDVPLYDVRDGYSLDIDFRYGVEQRQAIYSTSPPSIDLEYKHCPTCDTILNRNNIAIRIRTVTCPEGFGRGFIGGTSIENEACVGPLKPTKPGKLSNKGLPICEKKPGEKKQKKQERGAFVGNPINVATGNKFQSESDYSGSGPNSLFFSRYYNSIKDTVTYNSAESALGSHWSGSYMQNISGTAETTIVVRRPDGRGDFYFYNGTGYDSQSLSPDRLTKTTTGWDYTLTSETVESYNERGRLTSITTRNGLTQTMAYNDAEQLISVTNAFGRVLNFNYDDSGKLSTLTDPNGGVYTYAYDANDNLISVDQPGTTTRQYLYENTSFKNALTGIIDEKGDRFASWTYDSQGRAITSEHANGQENVTVTYGTNNTATVVDGNGVSRDYQFTLQNGLLKLANINGEPCTTCGSSDAAKTYDENGFVNSRTDFVGNVTNYINDARGLVLSRTEAAGSLQERTISTNWDVNNRIPLKTTRPSVSSGQNAITDITYGDATNPLLPTTIKRNGFTKDGTAVLERSINIAYTADGRVREINGPRTDVQDITTLTYYPNTAEQGNNRGQLSTVSNALGHTVNYNQYDAHGNIEQMTDANGNVTTYTYDPRQRVTAMTLTPTQGAARTSSYTYDEVGQLIQTVTADGITLSYDYDAAHYLTKITDNLNNQITYQYDIKGNRSQSVTTDPDGTLARLVDTTYDARDRISSINAAGSISQLVYDTVGNLTSQTDPNGNQSTLHDYDALNRLSSSLDALSGTTAYDYDVNDRIISVTSPNDAQTTYDYDDLGNMLSEQSPDRGTRSYTFDAAGNQLSLTDARNITVNYQYDELGRVTDIDYPGTQEDVNFTYDAPVAGETCTFSIGRLCNMVDESGVSHYSYDAFGNTVSMQHIELGISYLTQYSYDAGDNLSQVIYPGGRVVNMLRDDIRRVTSVSTDVNGTAQSIVSDVTYRSDNLLTSKTYGNGLVENRSYDLQGRLQEQGSVVNTAGISESATISLASSIPSPVPTGSSITFTTTVSEEAVYEYQYSLTGPETSGSQQVVQAFSLNNNWLWASSAASLGLSNISVEVRLAGSAQTRSQSIGLEVGVGPAESVTLIANPATGAIAGLPLQLNATATGAASAFEYRYTLQGQSTGNTPQVVQEYSTNSVYDWVSTPSNKGVYTVTVDTRNAGSTADSEASVTTSIELLAQVKASALTVTTDLPSPQKAGATINLNALASGGNVGEYEYRFDYRGPHSNNVTVVGEYGSATTYSLPTTEATSLGWHYIYVKARNVGSTSNQEVAKTISFNIQTSIESANALTVTRSHPSPQKSGITLNLDALASGGNVGEYEYRFDYRGPNSNNTLITGTYGPSTTYSLPTTEEGSLGWHYIYVKARNVGSTKNQEVAKTISINIQTSIEPANALTVTRDLLSPQQAGATINFTAQASGGNVGEYEYRFGHRGPETGNATVYGDYGPTSTYSFVTTDPASVGNNYIYVQTRNVGSTKTSEVARSYFYSIQTATAGLTVSNLQRVAFTPSDSEPSSEAFSAVLIRPSDDNDTTAYNYWLYSQATGNQWQQLKNKNALDAVTPNTLVYEGNGYYDIWQQNQDNNYRYQRVRNSNAIKALPKAANLSQFSQQHGLQKVALSTSATSSAVISGQTLATRRYNYDANGNVLDITNAQGQHDFGYDPLDRLINDTVPNTDVIEFNYDPNGNRTGRTQGTNNLNYTYTPNSNQLDSVGSDNLNRDEVGNTIEDTSPINGNNRTFEYNNANRLFKVFEGGSLVATYTYNALGQRTRKVTPSGTTVFHYDLSGQLISETFSDGRAIKDYVALNGAPVAQIDTDNSTAIETVTYLHTDHLATPRSGTDANGVVVWAWESDGFGNTQADNDPDGDGNETVVRLRFPGQYYDQETQLHYNWNRYYDPRVGRYITSDPIGLDGGLNTFGYVGGNPTGFIDPTGRVAGVATGFCFRGLLSALSRRGAVQLTNVSKSATSRAFGGLNNFTQNTLAFGAPGLFLPIAIYNALNEDASDDVACDDSESCEDDTARQKGERGNSTNDALTQLDEIEEAQRKVRQGKSNQIIDSIEKSKQRAKNKLKPQNIDLDDLDNF